MKLFYRYTSRLDKSGPNGVKKPALSLEDIIKMPQNDVYSMVFKLENSDSNFIDEIA